MQQISSMLLAIDCLAYVLAYLLEEGERIGLTKITSATSIILQAIVD